MGRVGGGWSVCGLGEYSGYGETRRAGLFLLFTWCCLISFYFVGSMAPDKGLRTGRAGSLQTTVRLLVVPDLLVSSASVLTLTMLVGGRDVLAGLDGGLDKTSIMDGRRD